MDFSSERAKLSRLRERLDESQEYYQILKHKYISDGYNVSGSRVDSARENFEIQKAKFLKQRELVQRMSKGKSLVRRVL